MKIGHYILIFLVIGAIIGFALGLYYQPSCPIDPSTGMRTECMGDPRSYGITGAILGALIGTVIGLILGKIVKKKK